MSTQRQKGTGYETYLIPILRRVWPKAERAAQSGVNDFGDFTNVGGWLLEAKKQETWTLPAWIRTIQKKVETGGQPSPWAILFAKDKRSGIPDLVAMPLETWVSQMEQVVGLRRQVANADHVKLKKLAAQAKTYDGKLARAEAKRVKDLDKLSLRMGDEADAAIEAVEQIANETAAKLVERINSLETENMQLESALHKQQTYTEQAREAHLNAERKATSLESQLRRTRRR